MYLVSKKSKGITDFTSGEVLKLYLPGLVEKLCIRYEGKIYIIKIDKDNHHRSISEYLATKVLKMVNLDYQEPIIGVYKIGLFLHQKYLLEKQKQ